MFLLKMFTKNKIVVVLYAYSYELNPSNFQFTNLFIPNIQFSKTSLTFIDLYEKCTNPQEKHVLILVVL